MLTGSNGVTHSMTAHQYAEEAVRAAEARRAAQIEVEWLSYLLQQQELLIRQCVLDCEQPSCIVVNGPACTRSGLVKPAFRCRCHRCNFQASWTEHFRHKQGSWPHLDRAAELRGQLREASLLLRQRARTAKAAANRARIESRTQTGIDD